MPVEQFALADDVDLITEELPFRLDHVDTEGYRAWIAVDGSTDAATLADMGREFAGFIAAEVNEAPSVFDHPDRLFICDIYVHESYRGSGLANELFDRVRVWAHETGCEEFSLDPHVEDDRAIAFYEKLGFETTQYHMMASIED